ncbi:MAG TPA: helix-turn-helix domain-containing protein [Xanthomonadaceae bacterium]
MPRLCRGLGLTRQAIAAVEAGKYAPTLECACRIADVFGKPLGGKCSSGSEEDYGPLSDRSCHCGRNWTVFSNHATAVTAPITFRALPTRP